jgi:hypothetical protein
MTIPIPIQFADQIRDYIKHGRKNLLASKPNKYLIVSRKAKVPTVYCAFCDVPNCFAASLLLCPTRLTVTV